MKILILGNKNSGWLAQFFEYCIRKQDEVVFFADSSSDIEFEVFNKANIQIVDYERKDKRKYSFRNPLGRINVVRKYIKILKEYGPFDVINVQFVSDLSSLLAVSVKDKHTKLIFSYWGSDLLRTSKHGLLRLKRRVSQADWVTFDNIDLQDKFNHIYGGIYKGRQECAYFGIPILEDIDIIEREYSRKQIKELWNIPQQKICVSVGYNGMEAQQHHKVLDAINALPEALKSNMFLLLQMTYGGTEAYKESVIQALNSVGIDYKVFLEYLPSVEIAKLRLATDVYINAQTTDAFSGSVCENLYCGNIVINAGWLSYKELVQFDIKHISFDGFEQLTQVLMDYIEGKMKLDTRKNKSKIASLRLWTECIKKWNVILYSE